MTKQTIKNLPLKEPRWLKRLLIVLSVFFIVILIVIPVISIFAEAFAMGIDEYFAALQDEDTLSAIHLTLFVAAICVTVNLIFGLSAGWALGKFNVPGKKIILSIIELPLSVSPVIAGLIFVLLLGLHSPIGGWLETYGIEIIFAVPGIVIATLFVTLPYLAREIIPLIEELGNEEEEAAILLGASGWKTFTKVTLPNIKWGVLYGTLITNARAMGEFGAVSIVSGHIAGKTVTLPLHIEILYDGYKFTAAFAVATTLALLALLTLVLKTWIELRTHDPHKKDF